VAVVRTLVSLACYALSGVLAAGALACAPLAPVESAVGAWGHQVWCQEDDPCWTDPWGLSGALVRAGGDGYAPYDGR
jgi:hypothetical protein